jgi:hypothetical protein
LFETLKSGFICKGQSNISGINHMILQHFLRQRQRSRPYQQCFLTKYPSTLQTLAMVQHTLMSLSATSKAISREHRLDTAVGHQQGRIQSVHMLHPSEAYQRHMLQASNHLISNHCRLLHANHLKSD